MIGWVRNAISELRPMVLENLAEQIRGYYPRCKSFYRWIRTLARNLFILQIDLTTTQTFEQHGNLLNKENDLQAEECGYDLVLLHQELTNELQTFLELFHDPETGNLQPF